jgi:hypothetical protein
MQSFREWLLVELKTGIDPKTKQPFHLGQYLRKNKMATFHVNGNGEVVPGMDSGSDEYPQYVPYVEIVPGYQKKWGLRPHNLQPTSKLFKNLLAWTKQFIPNANDIDVEISNLSHPEVGDPNKYYRSAGYWGKQANTDFSMQKIPPYLYHGTSTELWYEGIKQKGLMPREQNSIASSGSYGTDVDALSHGDKVYLAVHPDAAARSAAHQASSKHGGLPLIIRIKTAGLFPEKFGADEDASRRIDYLKKKGKEDAMGGATASQIMMGTVSYQGRVPPSNITPIMVQRPAPKGSNRVWKKWEPFDEKNIERSEHPMTKKLNDPVGSNFWSDDPEFYALYDAGLVDFDDNKGIIKKPGVKDSQVRAALKNAPWRSTATAISKQINDWGRAGLKSLDYYPSKVDNKRHQEIIDCFVSNKLYYVRNSGLLELSSLTGGKRSVHTSIGIAKCVYSMGLDYRKLNDIVKEINSTYQPE